jgi:hypothetical protein
MKVLELTEAVMHGHTRYVPEAPNPHGPPARRLCTLPELYGEAWAFVRRPKTFGKQFKRAVLDGRVPGVRWVREKSNRHQLYEVLH